MKNTEGQEAVWTIDMKTSGSVYKGESKTKPNVTLIMSDETFQQLAEGKVRFNVTGSPELFVTVRPRAAGRTEGLHDGQAEDEGQHDVCNQARRRVEGTYSLNKHPT